MPRIEIERIDFAEEAAESSTESFDRVAFAERALELVRPEKTKVAVCGGARRIGLEQGRQWGGAPGERWAILMVPANASRTAIANAVLGLAREPRAWALDVLARRADVGT